jgi:hypothetical protein
MMRSLEEALQLVLAQQKSIAKLQRDLKDNQNASLNAADKAERLAQIGQQIRQTEGAQIRALEDLVNFPPHRLGYRPMLDAFEQKLRALGQPAEKRVFIMTKYPDGKNPALDQQLQAVIDAVRNAVKARGYHPQLATDDKLHPNLWENIEIQMLGCGRGLAIVEDRFNTKLNSNVAMEWGWMRAMNKPVTYLVEQGIEQAPADVAGLIKSRFKWDDPLGSIPALVAAELP